MARMIRKQIVLEPELDKQLAEYAEKHGASQSEVVRAALKSYLSVEDEKMRRQAAWERLLWLMEHEPLSGMVGDDGRIIMTREERNERPGLRRFERRDLRK